MSDLTVRVTSDPISAAALRPLVAIAKAGAIVTFEGTVRDHHLGRVVRYLEYEAYAPMVERQLRRLAQELLAQEDITRIAVAHRFGRLEIGEVSVAMAVSSAHRAAAFRVCEQLIDRLKTSVPIWKKEFGEAGAHWIEGPDAISSATDQPE